jgi:hypothetical protein
VYIIFVYILTNIGSASASFSFFSNNVSSHIFRSFFQLEGANSSTDISPFASSNLFLEGDSSTTYASSVAMVKLVSNSMVQASFEA